MAELCSGDIVADIRTIYQSKIGSESGRAGARTRPNMDTASLVSDHHQFSSFLQLTLFLDTLNLSGKCAFEDSTLNYYELLMSRK